jgi:hypothetical protein
VKKNSLKLFSKVTIGNKMEIQLDGEQEEILFEKKDIEDICFLLHSIILPDITNVIVQYMREPPFSFFSKDDKKREFTVARKFANLSQVIREFPLDIHFLQLDYSVREIQLLIEYLNLQKGKPGFIPPQPLPSKNLLEVGMESHIYEWWKTLSKKEVYRIIILASFLDIKCLLHQGAAVVASWIKGVSHDRIRSILTRE